MMMMDSCWMAVIRQYCYMLVPPPPECRIICYYNYHLNYNLFTNVPAKLYKIRQTQLHTDYLKYIRDAMRRRRPSYIHSKVVNHMKLLSVQSVSSILKYYLVFILRSFAFLHSQRMCARSISNYSRPAQCGSHGFIPSRIFIGFNWNSFFFFWDFERFKN